MGERNYLLRNSVSRHRIVLFISGRQLCTRSMSSKPDARKPVLLLCASTSFSTHNNKCSIFLCDVLISSSLLNPKYITHLYAINVPTSSPYKNLETIPFREALKIRESTPLPASSSSSDTLPSIPPVTSVDPEPLMLFFKSKKLKGVIFLITAPFSSTTPST